MVIGDLYHGILVDVSMTFACTGLSSLREDNSRLVGSRLNAG